MAEESTFRGVIGFFTELGIYDVVLPFLLVFTIVFAILEKTKVLGVDKYGDQEITKKNLNAMTAFVLAFLVVVSSRLVSLINEAMANMVILLFLAVCFLILIGSFYKQGEDVYLHGTWRTIFTIIMFVGIILIFLHAIKTPSGEPWLIWFWSGWLTAKWGTEWLGAVVLIVFIVIVMYLITKEPSRSKSKSNEN